MTVTSTPLSGLYTIEAKAFLDDRGSFVKTFHLGTLQEHGLRFQLAESFYSISHKDVIRGMHFQIPPADHTKIVYVTSGKIMDVVLDIRQGSPTYGQAFSAELSAENHTMMYIPSGFAHGFVALADDSCVVYLQSTMHSPKHDAGIRFDSFGFNWGVTDPIMSQRDQAFPTLADFNTPFTV